MKKLPSMQCRTHLMARCGLKFIEQVIYLNPARLKSMTLVHTSSVTGNELFFPVCTFKTYPVYEKYTSSSSGFSAGSMDTG